VVDAIEDRRDLRRPGRLAAVPEHRQPPAGPKHPRDLGQRPRPVEPVEGLAAEHTVEALARQRDLLGGAGERLRLARDQRPHAGERLDRDHVIEPAEEDTRELAGARAEIGDGCVTREPDARDRLRRP